MPAVGKTFSLSVYVDIRRGIKGEGRPTKAPADQVEIIQVNGRTVE